MGKDTQDLLDAILAKARALGPEFEQGIVNTLLTVHHPHRERGGPLTVRDVKALKVGDVVWMRFREWDAHEWRVNEAVEVVEVLAPGEVETNVGSFGCTNESDMDPAVDENHGYADLSWAPFRDIDPGTYTRGKPMSYDEAKALKVGDVAWVRYEKDPDERGFRIDGPEFVSRASNGDHIGFQTTDFTFDEPEGTNAQATDTIKGVMTLWHAIPKNQG